MSYIENFMVALSVWKLVKFLVTLVVGTTLEPIPLPREPEHFASKDVSLIVPTIDFDENLIVSLRSWLSNTPKEIIIVTSAKLLDTLIELIHGELPAEERRIVQILSYPIANKRGQLVTGIQKATGQFIFFADDDVFWPPSVTASMLAGFECASVGVVGGFHRARGQNTPDVNLFNGWQALAARRLWPRKLDIATSVCLDGGVPCVSGRTAAYRSTIVQDPEFQRRFTNEYWLGLYKLNSGDDQFMTRWVVDQGWDIRIQSAPEAEIETTVLSNAVYLRQWLRWQRNAQRSYSKRLLFSKRFYNHPFLALKMAESLIMSVVQPLFTVWRLRALCTAWFGVGADRWNIRMLLGLFTYIPPLMGHLLFAATHPWFWKHIGTQLTMGAASGFLSAYTLSTLHKTGWGSREA